MQCCVEKTQQWSNASIKPLLGLFHLQSPCSPKWVPTSPSSLLSHSLLPLILALIFGNSVVLACSPLPQLTPFPKVVDSILQTPFLCQGNSAANKQDACTPRATHFFTCCPEKRAWPPFHICLKTIHWFLQNSIDGTVLLYYYCALGF